MAEALWSRLFTQGRYRNASVILLLQNMFPKGKYNTGISRNAQTTGVPNDVWQKYTLGAQEVQSQNEWKTIALKL